MTSSIFTPAASSATYSETPVYGIGDDFAQIRDQTHTFDWRVEGNKWYSNGQLAGGALKIEEVWENVNP